MVLAAPHPITASIPVRPRVGIRRAPGRPPARRSALTWAAAAAGTLLVLAAIVFRISGGDWFIVQTPSMGEAAPVGTLVLTAPLGSTPAAVGEIISFHPPTEPHTTYTHRVVAVEADGGLVTRGDINGADDGWRLHAADVIGRAVAVLPGVGWLIKAIPVLLAGGLLTVWLTGLIRRRDVRSSLRFVGLSLLITATLAWFRPLFGAMVLQVSTVGTDAQALVVSTGMLPIRIQTSTGSVADLVSGQVGQITGPIPDSGHYAFDVGLHLEWWGWLIVAIVCATPTVASLVLSRRREVAA